MAAVGCDYVSRYLDRFLDEGVRAGVDLNHVSDHLGGCPGCYSRLSQFFRTIELPASRYLQETLDELALSLYNLARAILRDRPPDDQDDVTLNIRVTETGGGSEKHNLKAGAEMIEDVQDYVGTNQVAGMDLEEVRAELDSTAQLQGRKLELALSLFRRITGMSSRYLEKAWNSVGVLELSRGRMAEAEAAFLKVVTASDGAPEVRSFAHCNLSYVFKERGDLDRAIRSAARSIVLAEEDGADPYFGRLAELYMRLLRRTSADLSVAEARLAEILSIEGGRKRLLDDLKTPSNQKIRDALSKSPLASRLADE